MLWQEDEADDRPGASSLACDLAFRVHCPELAVDHAWALSEAVNARLPWLRDEPAAAIHSIHGAASGNGWERPDQFGDEVLQLPRRTRLYLRLPLSRIGDAGALSGSELDIGGFPLAVVDCHTRPLQPVRTLFARSVSADSVRDEAQFVRDVAAELAAGGITVRRMLCGKLHRISTPGGAIDARSVLVDDVDPRESLLLQQQGVGTRMLLGCGIFLPHKSLAAVGEPQ